MKEIEILVEVKSDWETAKANLNHIAFVGEKDTIDYYFYDPLRSNLQLTHNGKLLECCRIRIKDKQCLIAYKIDIYDGEIWQYSDEFETECKDAKQAKNIFHHLGLQPLVTIHNIKHIYKTDKYEIVLENVKDLGNFLEVEYLADDDASNQELIKADILKFISSLNLEVGKELNSGKPELLLLKQRALLTNSPELKANDS